jgi:hypothetical protein
METKTIIQKIILVVALFISGRIAVSQTTIISKTLNATIYSKENFEESKQKLYAVMDSSRYLLSSISETKSENGNQKIIIEIFISEKDFNKIDKCLPDLGYISFKNLVSEDLSSEFDTAAISKELLYLKERKVQCAGELEKLKTTDTIYPEVWKELKTLEKQVYEKEKSLLKAEQRVYTPHKMIITICE